MQRVKNATFDRNQTHLPRYFLEIAYKGTQYHGWQVQPGARTVQEDVENALSVLLRNTVRCVGCGRTDTGVHASQFFLHFDSEEIADKSKLVYQLDGILHHDIVAKNLYEVNDDAHARFDAEKRTYRYYIHPHRDPFIRELSLFLPNFPDIDRMNEAAAMLIGEKDFGAFAKIHSDVKHHVCHVHEAGWQRKDEQWYFEISANRFLRNMVRAVVGTLFMVGEQKLSLSDFERVIESRKRSKAGKSVPAHALFLYSVKYPYLK